jgi:glucose-6-phosphate isomerase
MDTHFFPLPIPHHTYTLTHLRTTPQERFSLSFTIESAAPLHTYTHHTTTITLLFHHRISGAHNMDTHFFEAPLRANLPVLLGLLGA